MSSQVTQSKVKAFAVNNTMLFFAVILFAACMIGVPRFATGGNLMNILIQLQPWVYQLWLGKAGVSVIYRKAED